VDDWKTAGTGGQMMLSSRARAALDKRAACSQATIAAWLPPTPYRALQPACCAGWAVRILAAAGGASLTD